MRKGWRPARSPKAPSATKPRRTRRRDSRLGELRSPEPTPTRQRMRAPPDRTPARGIRTAGDAAPRALASLPRRGEPDRLSRPPRRRRDEAGRSVEARARAPSRSLPRPNATGSPAGPPSRRAPERPRRQRSEARPGTRRSPGTPRSRPSPGGAAPLRCQPRPPPSRSRAPPDPPVHRRHRRGALLVRGAPAPVAYPVPTSPPPARPPGPRAPREHG